MPILTSGRCVVLQMPRFYPAYLDGPELIVYQKILLFRMTVHSPLDLRKLLPISYCHNIPDKHPIETAYPSGLSVGDLENGKSDWTPEEIAEFTSWMDSQPTLETYLNTQFTALHEAIKTHPVWEGVGKVE